MRHIFAVTLVSLLLGACQSAYYQAAEQVGYHKREILVDSVVDARDAQGAGAGTAALHRAQPGPVAVAELINRVS